MVLRENSAADVARGAKRLEVEGVVKPTAARVMSCARGAQTLLTATAAAESSAPLHSLGAWRLKGVAEPNELFEATKPGSPPLGEPAGGDKAWRAFQGPLASQREGVARSLRLRPVQAILAGLRDNT